MVDAVLIEKILGDIKSKVSELRKATDITREIYRTDIRNLSDFDVFVQSIVVYLKKMKWHINELHY